MLASLSFESVSKVPEAKLFQRNFGKNPNQVPGRLHLTQFWKTSTKCSKCVRKAIRIHFNLKRAEKDVKCDPENEIEPLFVKVFQAAFGKSKQINWQDLVTNKEY